MSLNQRQKTLQQQLIRKGTHAAGLSPNDPKRKPFDDLVESIHTRDLLLVLSHGLVSKPPLAEPLQKLFKYVLIILPLRSNGVRDVFEFVVAVHPSTQGPGRSTRSERKGPDITPDALRMATRLLSSPPSFMKAGDWFLGIAPQILALLDGEKELASVAAYIIGSIAGPAKYGKPDGEGWIAFVLPIIENIAPPKTASPNIDSNIIVPSASLSQALKRLETLTSSHPAPALTRRLLRSIRLPLWVIASWPPADAKLEEIWLKPARRLLQTYFTLEQDPDSVAAALKVITNDLVFKYQGWNGPWKYGLDEQRGLCIVGSQNFLDTDNSQGTDIDVKAIDHAIDLLVAMLSETADMCGIPEFFLELFRNWMKTSDKISFSSSSNELKNKYTETKLIREMLDKLPKKLISHSKQTIALVSENLAAFVETKKKGKAGDQAIDQTTLVLSLLHIILSSPGFSTTSFQSANSEGLSNIEVLLEDIVNFKYEMESESAIADVARTLLQFLMWRDKPDTIPSMTEPARDKYREDLKQRDLAMSYLTTLDSPPPVRAEGLHLLTSLIDSKNIVVDVNSTMHLLCSLLETAEDYIYLHTIKTIVALSTHHPKTVITTLLDKYIDTDELLPLDTRLRLGEALTKTIESQSSGENFRGPYIQTLGTALLHISSLRPTKPVAAAHHAKENRLQDAKDKQAAKAWGGAVPDLDDMIVSKQEQKDNEILSRILEGWHGKRNSEDARIRTSALSIFSTALKGNISAFSSSLISEAVDLSIMILKLETEDSAAIIRRAAIFLILSLVQALDAASASGTKVAFSFVGNSVDDIREVLGYIEATDSDGLVKRHAADVRESLGNWRDKGLLDAIRGGQQGIEAVGEGLSGGLRGLNVNPDGGNGDKTEMRGRRFIIEEIE